MSSLDFPLKAELHVHSAIRERLFYCPLLYDSVMTVEEILERCVQLGIEILAITDHDSFEGHRRAKEIIRNQGLNILLVPAIEIHAQEGEVLAYGVEKPVPSGLPAAEVLRLIHEQSGLAVAAHPYNLFAIGNEARGLPFDAIDGYNSASTKVANRRAVELAKELGLPATCGSDAHMPADVGKGLTLFPAGTDTVGKVLECIKSGRFQISFTQTNLLEMLPRFVLANVKSQLGF